MALPVATDPGVRPFRCAIPRTSRAPRRTAMPARSAGNAGNPIPDRAGAASGADTPRPGRRSKPEIDDRPAEGHPRCSTGPPSNPDHPPPGPSTIWPSTPGADPTPSPPSPAAPPPPSPPPSTPPSQQADSRMKKRIAGRQSLPAGPSVIGPREVAGHRRDPDKPCLARRRHQRRHERQRSLLAARGRRLEPHRQPLHPLRVPTPRRHPPPTFLR